MPTNIISLIGFISMIIFCSVTIIVVVILILRYLTTMSVEKDNEGHLKFTATKGKNDVYKSCFDKFCDSRKWVMNISNVIDIYSDMYRMDSMIIMEQMTKVEERLLVLADIDKAIFMEILVECTKLDYSLVQESDAYKAYCNILYIIYNELKTRFKLACLENHFLDKNDKEWLDYREAKLDYIITDMNRDLSIYYSNNLIVSISDMQEYYKTHFRNKLKDFLSDIFDDVKKIAKVSQEKKRVLEKKLENLTNQICGIIEG